MFRKTFGRKTEGVKEGYKVSCVKICIMLNYYEVGIYLKYFQLHPMWKLLKMW